MNTAKYEVIDRENGKINEYGEFEFLRNLPCKIKVTYKGIEKITEINPYEKNDRKIIEDTKMTSLNWESEGKEVKINWTMDSWSAFERIEIWAKEKRTEKYEYIGYEPYYKGQFELNLDINKKYETLVRHLGENEIVIEEREMEIGQ